MEAKRSLEASSLLTGLDELTVVLSISITLSDD